MFAAFSRNGSLLNAYTGLAIPSTGKQKLCKTSDDNAEPGLLARTPNCLSGGESVGGTYDNDDYSDVSGCEEDQSLN